MRNQKELTLYGAPWCAYCKTLEAHLASENIEFVYKNVDEVDNEMRMLKKTNGRYLIPTVVVDGKAYQNPKPQLIKELINV